RNLLRLALAEPGGEPAAYHAFRDALHAFVLHDRDARVPLVGRPQLRGGVAEHQLLEPLRRMAPEPHPGHAAHREAAETDPVDAVRVEEREDVLPEIGDRVRTRRNGGAAMPAHVVAEHPEALG